MRGDCSFPVSCAETPRQAAETSLLNHQIYRITLPPARRCAAFCQNPTSDPSQSPEDLSVLRQRKCPSNPTPPSTHIRPHNTPESLFMAKNAPRPDETHRAFEFFATHMQVMPEHFVRQTAAPRDLRIMKSDRRSRRKVNRHHKSWPLVELQARPISRRQPQPVHRGRWLEHLICLGLRNGVRPCIRRKVERRRLELPTSTLQTWHSTN